MMTNKGSWRRLLVADARKILCLMTFCYFHLLFSLFSLVLFLLLLLFILPPLLLLSPVFYLLLSPSFRSFHLFFHVTFFLSRRTVMRLSFSPFFFPLLFFFFWTSTRFSFSFFSVLCFSPLPPDCTAAVDHQSVRLHFISLCSKAAVLSLGSGQSQLEHF